MTNALTLIRSLVIYSLCLPLAIFLGYLLAMPMDTTSFTIVICSLSLPLLPLLLKHHHVLLIAFWNTSIILFFLPGRPSVAMVLTVVSFMLSILQHILNRNIRFLYVPSVAHSLIFLTMVMVVTAEMTGGFGARLMGSDVYGGKRYFVMLAAIIGYFALTCLPIPRNRAGIYVAIYLLGTATSVVGNLAPYVPQELYFLFALFPVESLAFVEGGPASQRLGGLTFTALAGVCFIFARHGVRGLFDFGDNWRLFPFQLRGGFGINNPWRFLVFLGLLWVALLGGYRSIAIVFILLFVVQFYLEGLCRTQLLPALLLVGVLLAAVGLPFLDKMPLMVQRSLSFLPLDVDPIARQDAQNSSEWRLQMWRVLLPEVPRYLLLGKGYSIDSHELNVAVDTSRRDSAGGAETAMLAGDYHNGPLSVIIPLGVLGVVAVAWFFVAAFRTLLANYRYGDPDLKQLNTFLLAYFVARMVFFVTVFGALHVDLMIFTGLVGLSISLNGGVARPAVKEPEEKPSFEQFRVARAAR